jgi:lactoylglutathione lyase
MFEIEIFEPVRREGLKLSKIIMMTGVIITLMGSINAGDISLNAARVGGKDVAVLAKFYEAAFGLKEVMRIDTPAMLEIMLNFGDTAEAAKANPAAQVVIMPRADTDARDSIAHIIFDVTDMKSVIESVKAAGGTVVREPAVFGDTGLVFSFVADPDGNQIELLQHPKR